MNGPSRWACRVQPMIDSEPCGDAAACFGPTAPTTGRLLAIVDGLGHGAEAALAADAALRVLADAPGAALPDLMARADAALADLRGAALGLARLHGGRLQHLGIGNTRAIRVRGEASTRLPSHNGIVGGGLPAQLTVTELDVAPGDWLLLFTDGLDEHLNLPVRLPEWERDPATLCDHLLNRWRAGRDDAGVLVCLVGED